MVTIEPEHVAFVKAALEQDRIRRGVNTWLDLAKIYDVAPRTIREWREGRWRKADTVLIAALVRHCLTSQD